ncbi:MAG: tetratricopeptide repeat protein [Anaerolineae bacterium]|nr:tetratricopeptide repeat protein [Anaerolineae bacterium]
METFSAHVPVDRRLALVKGKSLPRRTRGAALFADISGFTPLTHTLSHELGAKQGAEEVLRHINPVYKALIAELHRHGGSVVGFAGDAITCWLDDSQGPAAPRAVACALAMQTAMAPFSEIRTLAGSTIPLGIKVAVSAGPACRFLVGDPSICVVEVLAGATLRRMAAAEGLARSGEVIASQEVIDQLGEGIAVAEWRDSFAVLAAQDHPVPAATRSTAIPASLTPEQARPWILPAVYDALQSGGALLGDLRPVTSLFLRFGDLDYDGDNSTGEKLDAYIRWAQAVIHRYDGTLSHVTIGDKRAFLHAPFGAPVAHEDDNYRALKAAIALQSPPADLASFRAPQIGISRGVAWTGICGSTTRHTYNVFGNQVNLAARLMTTAQPGQILVSERISQIPRFEFEYVGNVAYKGFAEAIPTFALVGESLVGGQLFRETLVGRERDLQQLVQAAQPAMAGRFAGAVVIYGGPGIGKSRLAHELRTALGDRVTWLSGQADPILRQPFNPFVYLLQRYFHQAPGTSAAENKRAFDRCLGRLLTGLKAAPPPTPHQQPPSSLHNSDELRGELLRTRSILGALLNLHWPGSLYESLDARGRYQNSLFAIKTLLLAESRLHPVVLELEDAHWFDEASHEMLTTISRNIADCPLLIVLTSRYADDGSKPAFALAADAPTIELDLDALSPAALRSLAEDILGGPIDDSLHTLLHEKTDANPFFAQQMLYYFRENDLLEQVAASSYQQDMPPTPVWQMKTIAFDLPASINAILIARIDRLTEQVKEVVQVAAVLGREFEVRILSHILRNEVLPEVIEAEQEQIWSALSELRYIFKHALLRDAAYDMQLRARLRELHRLAAAAYEGLYANDLAPYYADLAYHYRHARDVDKERQYARLAGEQAAAEFANDEAVRFFNRALELVPTTDHESRYSILLARENVHDLLGNRAAQSQDLETLAALAKVLGSSQKAAVALRQARYYHNIGDYQTAATTARQAIAWAKAAEDVTLQARGHHLWGEAARLQGDYTTAQVQLKQSLTQARRVGAQQVIASSLSRLGAASYEQGDYVAAQAYFERAMSIYREAGDQVGESNCLNSLGMVSSDQGDFASRQAYTDQSLQIKRAVGDRRGVAIGLNNSGERYRACGQYSIAREYYQEALRIFRDINERRGESICLNNLGFVCRDLGQYQQAEAYQQEGLKILQEIGNRRGVAIILSELGILACDVGKIDRAETYFQQALTLRREMNLPQNIVEDLAGLAQVALARGEVAQAATRVKEILPYLEVNPVISGAERPFRVHSICYQVLRAAGDDRAPAVLQRAYRLLQEHAATIRDDDLRTSYLQNVPYHHEIVEQFTKQEKWDGRLENSDV